MASKPLEWSHHAQADVVRALEFYALTASPIVARRAAEAIKQAAMLIHDYPLQYREGIKKGTREYVMSRFPYTLVYRVEAKAIRIVRVMHQAGRYFNV